MYLRVHLYHYDNNSYYILYVYFCWKGLSEELHLQAFSRFVNPEGRLESITALSDPN